MKINNQQYRSIWANASQTAVQIIDQTKLPFALHVVEIDSIKAMETAICTMQVRGAPLIGASAAYGIAIAMLSQTDDAYLQAVSESLIATRPTAVNLQWAVKRMQDVLLPLPVDARCKAAWDEAAKICDEDVAQNSAIAKHGLALFKQLFSQKPDQAVLNVLTHCNAGWLATVDIGTALGPIYAFHDAGLPIHVWVDETRPRNQGASLTAWELAQHGVPYTVIADNAGGHLMQHGQVDCCIVGADRIAANGDVCNKIGTYLKALSARDNDVPFYVAAPNNTIDMAIATGADIPIENRSARELTELRGKTETGEIETVNIMPVGDNVLNPAFDVTPHHLVTTIITQDGLMD